MKFYIEKTEVCFFSQNKEVVEFRPTTDMNANGSTIPYNRTPGLLWVHLDEALSFHKHISVLKIESGENSISSEAG